MGLCFRHSRTKQRHNEENVETKMHVARDNQGDRMAQYTKELVNLPAMGREKTVLESFFSAARARRITVESKIAYSLLKAGAASSPASRVNNARRESAV